MTGARPTPAPGGRAAFPLALALAAATAACVGQIDGAPADGDEPGAPDAATGCDPGAPTICDGDVLVACAADGTPVRTDCAASDAVCVAPAGADAACVNACEHAGIGAAGACTGPAEVTRCADGRRLETETCAAGAGCHVVDGVAACVGAEACEGVGPLGRCAGETLWRCDGALAITDCAAAGAVCAYGGDEQGYGCVAPESVGSLRVAGVIRFEDREVKPGALGPPTPAPARGVTVVAVDHATDAILATSATADDGSYVLRYEAPPGGMVRVVTYSRSRATVRPVRVRKTSGYLHGVGSAAFAAGASGAVDVLVTEASGVGAAYSAIDASVRAMDWLRARGVDTRAPLYVYWQQGAGSGSYYLGGENAMHLASDDGYDDVVVLHELGHYFQDEYSDSDNPGGPHDGSPADPRLAWGEGGATWLAIAVLGLPYYIDWSPGGGWYVELEDKAHKASPGSPMSQLVSEWMVAELLWDVGDGALDADGDPVARTHDEILAVMVGYLVSPGRLDRGRAGLDLVEWLDGWFVQFGLGDCAPMRELVFQRFGFPYDFAGPGGACP